MGAVLFTMVPPWPAQRRIWWIACCLRFPSGSGVSLPFALHYRPAV